MKTLASITLTPADLVRLVSPRLLSENPMLNTGEAWAIDLYRVPEGFRFDVVGQARKVPS